MNTQEIIDGYHAAEYKIAYIAKLSRDYKLPKSTIIAELFKSGYKYEEIKRSLKAEYAAAEKKHQQWIEAGKPETLYSEEPVEETKEPVREAKEPVKETKEELEKLLKDNIRLLNENETLWKENQDAKKAIEVLRSDKNELTKAIETQRLCIDRIETENAELKKQVEYPENVESVSCEECANDAINDLTKAKNEIDRLNTDIETATQMFLKERKKRKKLEKALLKVVMK